MALYVNTNTSSINAQNSLVKSGNTLDQAFERLSSGLRINSAADDAAGLQISNRLTSQINGLGVATRNANDGISLAQTAEGSLQESTNILQRMRELALQSANGSNSAEDRGALQKEVEALSSELDRISSNTAFGGSKILDGTFGNGGTAEFQVGSEANETISLSLDSYGAADLGDKSLSQVNIASFDASAIGVEDTSVTVSDGSDSVTIEFSEGDGYDDFVKTFNEGAKSLGISATIDDSTGAVQFGVEDAADVAAFTITEATDDGIFLTAGSASSDASNTITLTGAVDTLDISTVEGAQSAVDVIDTAIASIDSKRADLGAFQNRMESTISNLSTISENVSAARSRVRDADFAAETAKLTQAQIIQQASTTILAQANQRPQAALSLLG